MIDGMFVVDYTLL